MTATGDGQDPQLYYDAFVNTLKGLDASLIVSATPECQYGSLGSNPMADVVTTAQIDFFLCAFSQCGLHAGYSPSPPYSVQFFNNAKCNGESSLDL